MKQSKKQGIKEFIKTYGWSIPIVFVLIGTLAYFGMLSKYPESDKYYCQAKPEKCICDNVVENSGYFSWNIIDKLGGKDNFIKNYNRKYDTQLVRIWESNRFDGVEFEYCAGELRKKTQPELDINDCNNNPNDGKCKCEEYSITASCKEICPKQCGDNQCIYEIKHGECSRGIIAQCNEDMNTKWANFDDCLKSYPKTECEKGNSNYIERLVDFEVIDTSVTPHKKCILLDNNCVSAVRECQEKTEVEKLMDKDCDELAMEFDIHSCKLSKQSTDCGIIKQAWRQKKCQI